MPAPTAQVQSQGKKGCGGIGQILMVIVAVVVAAVVFPVAVGAIAGTAAGTAGLGASIAGGAAAGAAASVASQGVGMLTGVQDRFSWKGVALAAVSGGVGSGLQAAATAAGFSAGNTVATGALMGLGRNVISQGVSVALGLQPRFDWTAVALAGITDGVGARTSGWLDAQETWNGVSLAGGGLANYAVTGAASAIAGAASQSLMTGSSFGDNLLDRLPDVIGQTIGNMVAGGIAAKQQAAPRDPLMAEVDATVASLKSFGDQDFGWSAADNEAFGNDLKRSLFQRESAEANLTKFVAGQGKGLPAEDARRLMGLPVGASAGPRQLAPSWAQPDVLPANLSNSGAEYRRYAAQGLETYKYADDRMLAGWTNDLGERVIVELGAIGKNQEIGWNDVGALARDRVTGEIAGQEWWVYESQQDAFRSGPMTWYEENSPSYMADRSNQIAFREGPYAAADDVMRPYGMFALGAFGAAFAAPAVPGVIAWGGANIPFLTNGSIFVAEAAAGEALGGATLAGAGGAVAMHYGDDALRASQRVISSGARGVRIATEGASIPGQGASPLLNQIREAGGTFAVQRGQVGMLDIAEASRASGNEIALFRDRSTGQRYLRELGGIGGEIPENVRLILHTQPGAGPLAVRPSLADRLAIERLGQRSSVIINSEGTYLTRFRNTSSRDGEVFPIWSK